MPQSHDATRGQYRLRRSTKIIISVASVLVLIVTGYAWKSVGSLQSNLATAGGLGLGGGDDGAVDVLMVGIDSRTDAHGNPLPPDELKMLHAGDATATNTDTIVLVRVPNDGSSATALSIPRDSFVDVPGIGMTKINAAYGATKVRVKQQLLDKGDSPSEAEKESSNAGRHALVTAVADLTGITVDHYAEVGLLGFVLLTNAAGGVDVCLNNPVNDPYSGAHFSAGEQTLKGAQALSFVRQRHGLPRGDLDRIVRQQSFMASLVHKVLSAGTLSNPGRLDELSKAVQRSIVLDSDWDVVKFAQQLQNMAGGKVHFQTIPVQNPDATTSDGESIVKVNPDQVHSFVESLVGKHDDKTAKDTHEPTPAPATPPVNPATVTVDVSNATSISGLASGVSQALTSMGYQQGAVKNFTGSANATKILAPSTGDAGAKSVAHALGGLPITADTSLPAHTVQVVLADNYQGPGSQSQNGSAGTSTGSSTSESTGGSSAGSTPTKQPVITAGETGPKCVN